MTETSIALQYYIKTMNVLLETWRSKGKALASHAEGCVFDPSWIQ
jgi:hypothetical protein